MFQIIVEIAAILGAIFAGLAYFHYRQVKDTKIKTLVCELQENLNIAQTAKEWSTYSLDRRNLIEELKSSLTEENHERIRKLYPLGQISLVYL
ncbi:MAG: hypothetical protein ABH952_10415 [Candidatus Omnitrophota bacterium]